VHDSNMLAVSHIQHRNVRDDFVLSQPPKKRAGAISFVRRQAFGLKAVLLFHTSQHCFSGDDLLCDPRRCGFNIYDHVSTR
ncbi:MAG: hypothetical protein ACRD19_00005, partial [Terriglobia bacterium]